MDTITIFATQFVLSVLVFSLIGRWFATPWLAGLPVRTALTILLLPHAFRHIGLVFVVPAFVDGRLDPTFAGLAAYGDLVSAALAILALLLLRTERPSAIAAVWVFNLVGALDLVNALRRADVVSDLGVAWIIPTFIVPLLLVTHTMIFARLIGLSLPQTIASAPRPSPIAE